MSSPFGNTRFPYPSPLRQANRFRTLARQSPGPIMTRAAPVLYILTNSKNKTAYIGRTTNYQRRMKQHAANVDKDFDRTLLIDNPTFNQSATLGSRIDLLSCSVPTKNTRSPMPTTAMPNSIIFEQGFQYHQRFRDLWTKLAKKNTRFIRLKISRTPICSSSRLSRRLRPTNTKRSRRFSNVSNRSVKT